VKALTISLVASAALSFASASASAMPTANLAPVASDLALHQSVPWVCGPYRCWWRLFYYRPWAITARMATMAITARMATMAITARMAFTAMAVMDMAMAAVMDMAMDPRAGMAAGETRLLKGLSRQASRARQGTRALCQSSARLAHSGGSGR
jgi:hypothetical protein